MRNLTRHINGNDRQTQNKDSREMYEKSQHIVRVSKDIPVFDCGQAAKTK